MKLNLPEGSQFNNLKCVGYVALLRGINVGGKNLIKMADLRLCLAGEALQNVRTYIQSGNVLFESRLPVRDLSPMIEQAIESAFSYPGPVVVVSQKELGAVIEKCPPAFLADLGEYRRDVVFLKPPCRAQDVLPTVRLKGGVDQAFEGNSVLYFKRLISRASESYLPKVIANPAYKSMTVRNWNTTVKLHGLLTA
jgi:uncharacterized protein (DUF1697 family)